ncbi:MAG: PilZ domain-containing protein [Candidatus Susulua stagnicola]|nr:PilZ domain-containing protein [Candidatus Susulua stagnicola]
MKEKRQSPRVERLLPIKLSISDFDVLTETTNISTSGAYFPVSRPLELMTKLNVILLIPIKKNKTKTIEKVNCTGIIVRCEIVEENIKHPYRAAMYFSDLTDRNRKVLRSYINPFLES